MNLGFSHGTAPIHEPSPLVDSPSCDEATPSQLLARTAQAAGSSFFGIVNTSRFYVVRQVVPFAQTKEQEEQDKKRANTYIRRLKTEKTEPSNDQRPQK